VDRADLKKVDITQGDGPSFTVKGHYVEWQKVSQPPQGSMGPPGACGSCV